MNKNSACRGHITNTKPFTELFLCGRRIPRFERHEANGKRRNDLDITHAEYKAGFLIIDHSLEDIRKIRRSLCCESFYDRSGNVKLWWKSRLERCHFAIEGK